MRLIVQKYGGTSVGTPERIRNVAQRIVETQCEGCRVVAVISAMAGVTEDLLRLASAMSAEPTKRELDILLSTGERAASALVTMGINALGAKAISLTGAEAGILTDGIHTRARIANISSKQIQELLAEDYIVIVAGFQGQTAEGETTTLGRGGSDLSAIALAGALNADTCQIFTDVDGVFTCDPRIVSDAKKLDEVAYDELLEMTGAGAKVMQSRAVEFAKKFGVEFEVRSSFNRNAGTLAKEERAGMEDVVIRGVSIDRNGSARRAWNRGSNFLSDLDGEHRCRYDCPECFGRRRDRYLLYNSRSGSRSSAEVARAYCRSNRFARNFCPQRGGETKRRGDRDALAFRRSCAFLRMPRQRRHQHSIDLDIGDQDRRSDR